MKALLRLIFVLYFTTLFYILFLARRRPAPTFLKNREPVNLIPFKEKIIFFTSKENLLWADKREFYTDLLGNMAIFIPFAFFLVMVYKIKTVQGVVATAFFTSVVIETIQFILSIGVADIDDVLLNTTGACIGFFLCRLLMRITGNLFNTASMIKHAPEK